MKNPYPEFIVNKATGMTFHNDPHIYYKEGYDAKEKEDQELYEALKECIDYFRNEIVEQYIKDETIPYFEGYKKGVLALTKVEK